MKEGERKINKNGKDNKTEKQKEWRERNDGERGIVKSYGERGRARKKDGKKRNGDRKKEKEEKLGKRGKIK